MGRIICKLTSKCQTVVTKNLDMAIFWWIILSKSGGLVLFAEDTGVARRWRLKILQKSFRLKSLNPAAHDLEGPLADLARLQVEVSGKEADCLRLFSFHGRNVVLHRKAVHVTQFMENRELNTGFGAERCPRG